MTSFELPVQVLFHKFPLKRAIFEWLSLFTQLYVFLSNFWSIILYFLRLHNIESKKRSHRYTLLFMSLVTNCRNLA